MRAIYGIIICLALLATLTFTTSADAVTIESNYIISSDNGGIINVYVWNDSGNYYIIEATSVVLHEAGRFVVVCPKDAQRFGTKVVVPLRNIRNIIQGDHKHDYFGR